jgi:uncharacterized protein (TIGR02001 family)
MTLTSSLRRTALCAALATLACGAASAQTPAAATPPTPDWTVTGNVGIFSQYIFRGLSQTNEKPALQGGFDVAHKSGFYAGTWLSNVSWYSDTVGLADASNSLEWDMYGGYKWDFGNDLVLDVGGLYYYYPGSYPSGATKPNTFELYAALNWKFLQVKYSNSVDNKTFGFPNSRGSDYIEGNINYDVVDKVSDMIGKVTLIGHIGHQKFKHFGDYDYTDWKVGVATDVSGFTVGVAVTGTDGDSALYTNRFGRDISDTQFVAWIQKTF